jgi:hypothetical protein
MLDLFVGMQIARQVQERQFVFDDSPDRNRRRREKERSQIRRVSFLRRTLRPHREPARTSGVGRADPC